MFLISLFHLSLSLSALSQAEPKILRLVHIDLTFIVTKSCNFMSGCEEQVSRGQEGQDSSAQVRVWRPEAAAVRRTGRRQARRTPRRRPQDLIIQLCEDFDKNDALIF